MTDVQETQSRGVDKRPRAVDYEMYEMGEDLPDEEPRAGRVSQYATNLDRIQSDPTKHGKWYRISAYRDPSGAVNRKNKLIEEHGNEPAIHGWEFSTRKISDTHKATGDELVRGLFAKYTPDAIVDGRHDEWKRLQEKKRSEKDATRARAKERKSAEAQKSAQEFVEKHGKKNVGV